MGSSNPTMADMFAMSVAYLERIELADSFGNNYRNGVLAMRMAGLRLSRLGVVMSIQQDAGRIHSNGSSGQLQTELQKLFNHFRSIDLSTSHNAGGRLSAKEQGFVNTVQQICQRRQGSNAGPGQLTRAHVVTNEKDFQTFLGNVLKSLDQLDALRSTTSAQWWEKLTAEDAESLSLDELEELEGIKRMLQTIDPDLVKSSQPKAQGNSYRGVRIRGFDVRNGDWVSEGFSDKFKTEGNEYEDIVVENGRLINGNTYGGSGFFSSK